MSVQDSTSATELLQLDSLASGPKKTTSLQRRQAPLASTKAQLELLNGLDLNHLSQEGHFFKTLEQHGWQEFEPVDVEIFQINIGKLCNMACRHCHVDAGPTRVDENMDKRTIDACLAALDQTNATMVDITGGAPELNPHFKYLVEECVKRGKHVMNRCNLTILTVPKYRDMPAFFAENKVEIVCSLPHYRRRNTDAQRGSGTYEKSIKALEMLNEVGYGKGDPEKRLTLVSNPAGAFLSGSQASMEAEWKAALDRNYGLSFDRLITINNLPISRYLEWLEESGNLKDYMELLVNSFNPNTISGLMCRNTLSVSWDGRLYDCDFNQMLDLESQTKDGQTLTIFDFDPEKLRQRAIVTERHCYGCTAGAGSSCGGAIET